MRYTANDYKKATNFLAGLFGEHCTLFDNDGSPSQAYQLGCNVRLLAFATRAKAKAHLVNRVRDYLQGTLNNVPWDLVHDAIMDIGAEGVILDPCLASVQRAVDQLEPQQTDNWFSQWAQKFETPLRESRIWVLGSQDAEMDAIEGILRTAGEKVIFAVTGDKRVTPREAYDFIQVLDGYDIYNFVECKPAVWPEGEVHTFDHHQPGDLGYGIGPARFWEASSLGQVWRHLRGGQKPPQRLRVIAAADHCLAAAYAGNCPGVAPETVRMLRSAALCGPIEPQVAALKAAPEIKLGGRLVRDLRDAEPGDWRTTQIVTEAALQLGVAAISNVIDAKGSPKTVIVGGGEGAIPGAAPIQEFMDSWGPENGLTDIYGDPVRGFAGGYKEQ